jgi:hypothetical protein
LDPIDESVQQDRHVDRCESGGPGLGWLRDPEAIDGLFVLIAEEEARIRKDPMARTTDLLKRVFAAP